MTTQIVVASTAFGLATVVAALDDGALPGAGRRVLVVCNNATEPEITPGLREVSGIPVLLDRFDDVYDFNAAIAPQHPSLWRPRAVDLPIVERYLSGLWSLGDDDLHLVVESIQVSPALTLCQVFPDARIDVYADGLMSYGPTRNQLPGLVASRIERLLHLDLVPGLRPVLLTEFDVPAQQVATSAFTRVIESLGEAPAWLAAAERGSVAVLLGQYLASATILTVEEELGVHLKMVRGAVAAGFTELVFKPHPSAADTRPEALVAEAVSHGARLRVVRDLELVETWFRHPGVGLVVGCFSTALATAVSCYALPAGRVGTHLLLDRLRPYQNSNRVPVTIVDALIPHVLSVASPTGVEPDRLNQVVRAVSYCMQPLRYPALRAEAEQLLTTQGEAVAHYFKRRRLTQLGLPGGLPDVPRPRVVPLRRTRRVIRWLLGPRLAGAVARAVQPVLH